MAFRLFSPENRYFCGVNQNRDKEKKVLLSALTEEYSQFIAVYGRRRIGKTFLIRETFDNRFDFQYTGAANLTARKQLVRFRRALKEHGHAATESLMCAK